MGCCISVEDPEERILKEYQETVTPEIALRNLHGYLAEHGTHDGIHRAIFDAYSVQEAPQEQPYWTKESFRNHITSKFPGDNSPATAIDLLWPCFCFYAQHPFPRHDDLDNVKLERPEFERAVIMLAYKGTMLLGTVMMGMMHLSRDHWAYRESGRPCTCRQNLDRILRSISQRTADSSETNRVSWISSSSIKDDMMDVIATTQPNRVKAMTGTFDLEPPAQRLLAQRGASYHYRLSIDSFATFMKMLTRVRLYQSIWSQQNYPYGTLEEPNARQDELVNILLKQFQLSEGFLAPDSISRVFDILPNIELRFHQLWAMIFQPRFPKGSMALGRESLPNSTISDVLRAVSLFVPPGTEFHGKREDERKIRPGSFTTIYQPSAKESSFSSALLHFMKSLAEKDDELQPHLLLFLGDQTPDHSHIPEIMGVLFAPTLEEKKAHYRQRKSEKPDNSKPGLPEIGPPQLFFQLQPNLRIFRLKETEGASRHCSSGIVKSPVHSSDAKYWMGDPGESEISLKLDPNTNHATLLRNRVSQDQSMYQDILQIDNHDKALGISESFAISQVAIYALDGGDQFNTD